MTDEAQTDAGAQYGQAREMVENWGRTPDAEVASFVARATAGTSLATAPAKPVIELPRLSHSQLSTWLQCGEAYRLEKIEKAPQTQAAWFASGTAFHAGMEAWELSGRTMAADEATSLAVARYDEEIASFRAIEPDIEKWRTGGAQTKPKVDIARRREKVALWVPAYVVYALGQPWRIWRTPDGEPAIELAFEIEFSGCIVRGYIDQVIEWPSLDREIVDAKTGAKQPDRYTQLGIYALGCEIRFGVEHRPAFGHFYMAKDSKTTKPLDLSGYTFAKLERWFNDLARARALSLYIPSPSEDNCRPCGVRDYCSAIDGERRGKFHPDPSRRWPEGFDPDDLED